VRVLVTGGAGFIGKHVVNELFRRGHAVNVVDLKDEDSVDILNLDALVRRMEWFRPDVVIHLAADMPPYASDSLIYLTNVIGTKNVIEASRIVDVKKIVFASSAAVYGNGVTDEMEDLNPISAYGISKMLGELMLKSSPGVDYTVLRFFNVYGEHGHGVVNLLERSMKEGKKFVLFNGGTSVRDFVHVSFVADAVIRGMELPACTVNVGTGVGTTMSELAESAVKHSPFELVVDEKPNGEIQTSIAHVKVLKALMPDVFNRHEGFSIEDYWKTC